MPYIPPAAPDFSSSHAIDSLVTFTSPEGAFSLGSDDCWIEVSVLQDRRRSYIVHCFYAARYGANSYIEGDARAVAEEYLAKLVEGMGGLCTLIDMKTPKGNIKIPRSEDITRIGTIANPFTTTSYAGVILVAASHQDEGGRAFGFDLTFEQASVDGTDIFSMVADATYNNVPLGNSPAIIRPSVKDTQLFVEVTVYYNAILSDRLTYAKTLAEDIGFGPILIDDIPRGVSGNRSLIRSFESEPWQLKADKNNADPGGVLYPSGLPATYFIENSLYIQEMQTADNGDLLELTLTFIKSR